MGCGEGEQGSSLTSWYSRACVWERLWVRIRETPSLGFLGQTPAGPRAAAGTKQDLCFRTPNFAAGGATNLLSIPGGGGSFPCQSSPLQHKTFSEQAGRARGPCAHPSGYRMCSMSPAQRRPRRPPAGPSASYLEQKASRLSLIQTRLPRPRCGSVPGEDLLSLAILPQELGREQNEIPPAELGQPH